MGLHPIAYWLAHTIHNLLKMQTTIWAFAFALWIVFRNVSFWAWLLVMLLYAMLALTMSFAIAIAFRKGNNYADLCLYIGDYCNSGTLSMILGSVLWLLMSVAPLYHKMTQSDTQKSLFFLEYLLPNTYIVRLLSTANDYQLIRMFLYQK